MSSLYALHFTTLYNTFINECEKIMAIVIGANREEWILKEMARRAGKKYEPEGPKSIYDGMTADELKKHQDEIKSLLEDN